MADLDDAEVALWLLSIDSYLRLAACGMHHPIDGDRLAVLTR